MTWFPASEMDAMAGIQLPLEDTFGDVLRKAMRGVGIDTPELASASGVSADAISRWLKDEGTADDRQARELAAVLRLDGSKLADVAAARWYPPPVAPPRVSRHAQDPQPSNGYVFFLE